MRTPFANSGLPTLEPRQIVLGLALLIGTGYLGFQYVYRPRLEVIAANESRLAGLREQNRVGRALVEISSESDGDARLRELQHRLIEVERQMPSSEDFPDVLDLISAEARAVGVDLNFLYPLEPARDGHYLRESFGAGVVGSYHRVGQFLTNVASLPRLLTPTDLVLTSTGASAPNGEPLLDARFTINSYVQPTPRDTSEHP